MLPTAVLVALSSIDRRSGGGRAAGGGGRAGGNSKQHNDAATQHARGDDGDEGARRCDDVLPLIDERLIISFHPKSTTNTSA